MNNAPALEKGALYCEKIMTVFGKSDLETFKEQELVDRALLKLKKIIGI